MLYEPTSRKCNSECTSCTRESSPSVEIVLLGATSQVVKKPAVGLQRAFGRHSRTK